MTEQSIRPDGITTPQAPPPLDHLGTHEVTNQVPPRADGDVHDPALVE